MVQQLNGFYKITVENGIGKCHFYPPAKGGSALDIKDFMSVMDKCGFSSYNMKEVAVALNAAEESDVILGPKAGEKEINDISEVFVEIDKMSAKVRIFPGTSGGNRTTVRDIMGDLMMAKVKFGIDQDAILDIIQHPVYCQEVVIAKGKAVVHGKDASIEYFFNTKIDNKPALLPDGSVDFHDISVITEIHAGDLLARLTPEDKGQPGTDVYGSAILPRNVKSDRLSIGRNIKLSEDKLEAYSEVTGLVSLTNGQIFVSDNYEVPADVDNSTGDINFAGSVHVKGNIKDGFAVNAEGDIIVEGNVEGALVTAGGNIIIKRGINGMGKGVVEAAGNVIVKFVENGKVFAGGFVQSGSCINSQITAKGDVCVSDSKGFITGGVIKSGGKVEACTIGSAMGSNTLIEVGLDPDVKDKYIRAQNDIMDINTEIQKITPVIATYSQVIQAGKPLDDKNKTYYVQLLNTLKVDQEKLTKAKETFEALRREVENADDSRIIVKKDIYPGVTVSFSDVSMTVKDKRSFCAIEKKGADIVFVNL